MHVVKACCGILIKQEYFMELDNYRVSESLKNQFNRE